MFLQLQTLRFFPIVAADAYKSWKDLDKQEIAVHARGSGTEAIMKLMAMKHGISYANISYVPGSEVRAGALLQGNIKASILDAANTRKVMQQAPGKFAVLPMEGVNATDESLFANAAFLDKEAATIDRLVEAVVTTYREVAAKPETIAELRKKYRLLPDLPAKTEEDIVPAFKELAASKAIPLNGGGEDAARTDFAFFTLAGQLKGEAKDLKSADFWDFSALDRVLKKIGTQ
jgi:NitT/TauT family transport system substrate-binding protein